MRARFTTDEIAAAALSIVDEAGVGALSMRALAAALGTGPMTVYNYVPDKEGLEELVVAAVVAEVAVPEPTGNWIDDVYAMAEAMWLGIRAHPAAIPLVLTRRTSSATGFAVADALIAALGRGGLTDSDRLAAFHAVLGVRRRRGAGRARRTVHTRPRRRRRRGPHRFGRRRGAIPTSKRSRTSPRQVSVEEDFAQGLRMLLDGIAARGTKRRRR